MSDEQNSEPEKPAKLPPIEAARKAKDQRTVKTKFGPGEMAPPFTARKTTEPDDATAALGGNDKSADSATAGDEPEEGTDQSGLARPQTGPEVPSFFQTFPGPKTPLLLFGPIVLAICIFAAKFCYDLGVERGQALGDEAAAMGGMQLPPAISTALNDALFDLRKGDSKSAVRKLQVLEKTPPGYPSVTYLIALAAMQDGDISLSEQKIKDSIGKRERISDSLGLQAVLETQKAHDPSRAKLVDPRRRAELLLRQAIIADAANPYPHFELATLLRYRGERDEALQEIQAAQARLNPVDSHTIMELTSSIMQLESLPKYKLPTTPPDSDDIRKLFPAAYAAMRLGDFPTAVTLLRKCRKLSSPDIFDYAVNDPAIRKYSHQPELAEFFEEAPQ